MAIVSSKNIPKFKKIYLTSKGLVEAREELKYLKEVKRVEVASLIAHSIELGNLEENSEYDSALSEQNALEDRIFQLEQIIREAKIIKVQPVASDFVTIGSTVVLKLNREVEEFTIVGSVEANPAKKMISNESPVGSALLGRKVGEEAQIKTPQYSYKCKILEIR